MGSHSQPYARPIVPNPLDPVDFRAFYPYHPNEVKHRKRTTSQQLKVLEAIFKKDTKPNATLRTDLAAELSMTARGVQVWFQNRRAKEKVKSGKGSKGSSKSNTATEDTEESALVIKDEAPPNESLFTEGPSDESQESPDAFSRSPSTSSDSPSALIPSPPQLHVFTDAASFGWNNSPIEPHPESATSSRPLMFSSRTVPPSAFNSRLTAGNEELYSVRRGSLPANAFPQPQQASEIDVFDSLVRRRSVDASLQRLASNPFASHARAKNSALYGPGVGVVMPGADAGTAGGPVRHHSFTRQPYAYHPRRGVSSLSSASSAGPFSGASLPQHGGLRRLSMDSRAGRFAPLSRLHQTPSPSPLTPYSAVVRASLPDHHLYAVTSRPVASPIPGPLPSPGFSFGAASSSTPSMASPSSGDSERNSPDSLRSFNYRGEEQDEDSLTSPYDAYSSRFGSIASIATSESSVNSAYYAELGGSAVDQTERRDSCASGHFLGMLSGLEVNNQGESMHQAASMGGIGMGGIGIGIDAAVGSYSPHEEYSYPGTEGVELVQEQQQGGQQQLYASPASTISPGGPGIDGQNTHLHGTSSVPISTSSELAFALDSKQPEQTLQEAYVNYGHGDHHVAQNPSEHQLQHETSYFSHQPTHQQEQMQHHQPDHNVAFASPYTYVGEAQQQHLDYAAVYTANGEFSDPNVLDNGLQSVDAFVAYT